MKRKVYLPAEFARAVCNSCYEPVPTTSISQGIVYVNCRCGNNTKDNFEKFDYWMNHNLLGITKLSPDYNFSLWMLGYDHKQYHSGAVKERIIDEFGLAAKSCSRVYAPLILREDGKKMGKSNGNVGYIPIDIMLDRIRGVNERYVVIKDRDISSNIDVMKLNAK